MSEEVKNLEEVTEDVTEEVTEETVNEKKSNEPEISKSKAKRNKRKADAKAAKRKNIVGRVIEIVVEVAIAALFISVIVMGIYKDRTKIVQGTDYSGCLTEEGFISGADLSTVKDIGLANLVIPASEVEVSDETIQSDIDSILSSYTELKTDADLEAALDDKVNIDYVGSVDGVEFEGGNSNGEGYDLTLGTNTFIDTFEDQLVGSHPGDNVTVNVTFPETYENNPDLAGKAAVFEVTVNGIYVAPELTDEFVAENCSDKAATVDELREYYKNKHLEDNIDEYITTYISDNAEASKVPSKYVKNAASLLYTSDEQSYEYMNSYYSYYLGYSLYSSFSDYTGMSDDEYQKDLKERARAAAVQSMTYEAVYKNNNLSYTEDDYNEVVSTYGESAVETYGEPFLKQTAMKVATVNFIKEHITIQ